MQQPLSIAVISDFVLRSPQLLLPILECHALMHRERWQPGAAGAVLAAD